MKVKIIIVVVVVALLVAVGYVLFKGKPSSGTPATAPVSAPVSDTIVPIQNAAAPQKAISEHTFGIMIVSYPDGMDVKRAVLAKVNGSSVAPQASTIFADDSQYSMYLSGISGFTEYRPDNATTTFINVKGSDILYDEAGNRVLGSDNVFSQYVNGVPSKDLTAVTLSLTLGKNFKKGNYRWESIVTNIRNPDEYIKSVASVTVK